MCCRRPRSLLESIEADAGQADDVGDMLSGSSSVQWGGHAGATGLDMEEQEELLKRFFKPDRVQKIMKQQLEIDDNYADMKVCAIHPSLLM